MGFVKDRDYVKHLSETDCRWEEGEQPDFVLNLPGNRHVIIDSKVSLTAYTEYVNAEDETSTKTAMKRTIAIPIRNHAKKLASKNYEHMESINTLDFVLMAVPLEGLHDAMRADPNLYEDMVGERKVKIVN